MAYGNSNNATIPGVTNTAGGNLEGSLVDEFPNYKTSNALPTSLTSLGVNPASYPNYNIVYPNGAAAPLPIGATYYSIYGLTGALPKSGAQLIDNSTAYSSSILGVGVGEQVIALGPTRPGGSFGIGYVVDILTPPNLASNTAGQPEYDTIYELVKLPVGSGGFFNQLADFASFVAQAFIGVDIKATVDPNKEAGGITSGDDVTIQGYAPPPTLSDGYALGFVTQENLDTTVPAADQPQIFNPKKLFF